jgi:hypothetical protein
VAARCSRAQRRRHRHSGSNFFEHQVAMVMHVHRGRIHGASKAFKPSMWSFFVMIFNVVVFYSLVHFLLLAQLFVTTYVTSVWYFHATEENRCSSAIDNGVEAAQLQSGTIAVAAFVRAVVETLVYFCERALKLSRKGQQSEQSCLRGTCECLVKVFLRCGLPVMYVWDFLQIITLLSLLQFP